MLVALLQVHRVVCRRRAQPDQPGQLQAHNLYGHDNMGIMYHDHTVYIVLDSMGKCAGGGGEVPEQLVGCWLQHTQCLHTQHVHSGSLATEGSRCCGVSVTVCTQKQVGLPA